MQPQGSLLLSIHPTFSSEKTLKNMSEALSLNLFLILLTRLHSFLLSLFLLPEVILILLLLRPHATHYVAASSDDEPASVKRQHSSLQTPPPSQPPLTNSIAVSLSSTLSPQPDSLLPPPTDPDACPPGWSTWSRQRRKHWKSEHAEKYRFRHNFLEGVVTQVYWVRLP